MFKELFFFKDVNSSSVVVKLDNTYNVMVRTTVSTESQDTWALLLFKSEPPSLGLPCLGSNNKTVSYLLRPFKRLK